MGGLVTSTALTLLVLPALYVALAPRSAASNGNGSVVEASRLAQADVAP
jgi:hypothetical protein